MKVGRSEFEAEGARRPTLFSTLGFNCLLVAWAQISSGRTAVEGPSQCFKLFRMTPTGNACCQELEKKYSLEFYK